MASNHGKNNNTLTTTLYIPPSSSLRASFPPWPNSDLTFLGFRASMPSPILSNWGAKTERLKKHKVRTIVGEKSAVNWVGTSRYWGKLRQ